MTETDDISPAAVGTVKISDREFAQIQEMVYAHCRIRLGEGKRELVRARLGRCLRASGIDDVATYLAHVAADESGREFSRLIDAISTNLTSFFRERDHFTFIEKRILNDLLTAKRAAGSHRIRIWSAGCSTGEEPYSLAMLMHHLLGEKGHWDVKILGTDISRRVLRVATEGKYDDEHVALVPEPYRSKYFHRARRHAEEGAYVAPEVRQMVKLRYLNLADNWPFKGPFDFIFCRNVMIYFDTETQQKLVTRFCDVLAPHGHLFTGHSESLNGLKHHFRYVEPTIYRK